MNAKHTTQTSHALGLGLESRPLPHERLDVFRVAIALVEHVAQLAVRRGSSSAHEQLRRASSSVALNFAEGCGHQSPRQRRRFFAIARGSVSEVAAAVDVAHRFGVVDDGRQNEIADLCDHISAMLFKYR